MPYARWRIGEVLVGSGLITMRELDDALNAQRSEGGRVGEILVRRGVLTEDEIAGAFAKVLGMEHLHLTSRLVDPAAVGLLPERFARMRRIVPIAFDGDTVVVAMADPMDVETLDEAAFRMGRPVRAVACAENQVFAAIDQNVGGSDDMAAIAATDGDAKADAKDEVAEQTPVVRLLDRVLRQALGEGASDIHFEPHERGVLVRLRVDGVLHSIMSVPLQGKPGLTSRLKILSGMDISERRRPQDGHMTFKSDHRAIDMRVATLPTPHGESVAIRVMNEGLTFRTLEGLGMRADDLQRLRALYAKPYGCILISGPTGSGKSTTLYAVLKELSDPGRKVISVEDPVECDMADVTQMEVNAAVGLTFAAGLRTVLRSDPDVVMIGEIRDPETAEIAVRAALTGHLVLSSIHTNDAPSALTRLSDMSVPAYVSSSSMVGIVAQRLARRLCDRCKSPVEFPETTLLEAGFSEEEIPGLRLSGPVGCSECSGTGYRGRVGIFEVMAMNDDIRASFLAGEPSDRIRTAAIHHGMRTLRRDALDKVAGGEIGLDEVERIVV